MIEVDMIEAEIRFSQLVEAAERGEQVFVKRNGVLIAQIAPVSKTSFPFGFLKDQVGSVPDSLLFNSLDEEFNDFTGL